MINRIYDKELASLSIAGGLYLLIIAFATLILVEADLPLMLVALPTAGAISLFIYWKLAYWGSSRYGNFGALLLLISIAMRCISLVDVVLYGDRMHQWPLTVPIAPSIDVLFIKGELITHFGILITVASWRLAAGAGKFEKFEKFDFFRNLNFDYSDKRMWLYYLIGIFFTLAIQVFNIDFGALAQLISSLITIGIVAIFFLAQTSKNKYTALGIAIALALPFSYFALSSGMKENIFFPLVPAVILAWFLFRSFPSRVILVGVALIVLSVAQIFVTQVREYSWVGNERLSTGELFQDALKGSGKDDLDNGLEGIFSRLNPSSSHAITVAISERDGFLPTEIYGPIITSFIPRIFWPDKPILRPGLAHTERILDRDLSQVEISSATAPGIFAEMYLGGGVFGLVIASIMLGFLAAKVQILSFAIIPGFGLTVMNFRMLYLALRFDEQQVTYVYTGLVLFFILLVFIIRAIQIFSNGRGRA